MRRRGEAPGRVGAVVGSGVAAPGEAVREGILGSAIGVVVEAYHLRGVAGLCPVDAVVLFSDGFQKRLARGAVHPLDVEKGLVGVVGHRRLPSICSVDAVPHGGGFGLVERMVDLPATGTAEGPGQILTLAAQRDLFGLQYYVFGL